MPAWWPGSKPEPGRRFHFGCRREAARDHLSSRDGLGPYEIVAPLGADGMGEVYRARATRLGRDVALKLLPPETTHDPARRAVPPICGTEDVSRR